jgi:hypothetical protein
LGAIVAITAPLFLIGAFQWCFASASLIGVLARAIVTLAVIQFCGLLISVHLNKTRLHVLRDYAVESIDALVANFSAFDRSSAAAITMIQEVEAVSRGYHL